MKKDDIEGTLICYKCKGTLRELGAILLSPPSNIYDIVQNVEKRHMCKDCYKVEVFGDPRYEKVTSNGNNIHTS